MIKPLIEDAGRTASAMIANAATEPHKAQKRLEPPRGRQRHGSQARRRRYRNPARGSRRLPRLPALQGCHPDRVRRRPANRADHAGRRAAGRQGRPRRQAVRRAGRRRCSTARWKKPGSTAARSTSPMRSSISSSCRAEKSACTRSRTRRRSRRAGHGTNGNWPRSNPSWWWRWAPPRRKACSGKITPINKNRGRLIDLDDGTRALVTVHPSYLLRLPDAEAKAREYQRFVQDLKIAADCCENQHMRPELLRAQSGSRNFW